MKLKDFKVGFPIAAVWFGGLVGPSLLTGVTASVYFAPYGGVWAVIFLLLTIVISTVIVSLAGEVSRRNKAYDFGSMGKAMYGKYSNVLGVLLDILMLCSVLVNAAALIAVWNTLVADIIGASHLVGYISIIVICMILTLYGAGLVRKTSVTLTVVMLVGLIALLGISIGLQWGNWGAIFSSTTPVEGYTVGKGFGKNLGNAFYCTTFALHLAAVNQNLKTSKHTVAFGISAAVLNLFAYFSTMVIILPYAATAVEAGVPMLSVITEHFGSLSNAGKWIYTVTMFFAIISSCVPVTQSFIARLDKYLPRKGAFEKAPARNAFSAALYWIVSIVVSTVGLTAIVSKAWTTLGWATVFLLVIPCAIIAPIKWSKEKKIQQQ